MNTPFYQSITLHDAIRAIAGERLKFHKMEISAITIDIEMDVIISYFQSEIFQYSTDQNYTTALTEYLNTNYPFLIEGDLSLDTSPKPRKVRNKIILLADTVSGVFEIDKNQLECAINEGYVIVNSIQEFYDTLSEDGCMVGVWVDETIPGNMQILADIDHEYGITFCFQKTT